jgi:hypothetical protein
LNKHDSKTILLLLLRLSYYHLFRSFARLMREIRSDLRRGKFDLGYATVAKCTVQVDDEEVGTLREKHGKGYE